MLDRMNTTIAAVAIWLSALWNVQAATSDNVTQCLHSGQSSDSFAWPHWSISIKIDGCEWTYSFAGPNWANSWQLTQNEIEIYYKNGLVWLLNHLNSK